MSKAWMKSEENTVFTNVDNPAAMHLNHSLLTQQPGALAVIGPTLHLIGAWLLEPQALVTSRLLQHNSPSAFGCWASSCGGGEKKHTPFVAQTADFLVSDQQLATSHCVNRENPPRQAKQTLTNHWAILGLQWPSRMHNLRADGH